LARKLEARDDPTAELPASTDEKYLSHHVVLVGYGRVGRRIAEALKAHNLPFVVAEQNRETVERLRAQGTAAVSGDAVEAEVMVQAHIAQARMLVIATPDTLDVRQMVATARALNPEIDIVVRTHNEAEARLLESEKAGKVFLGEQELAQSMTRHVLERSGAAAAASNH
jgi:CPA2 family monovalent cation:H+ antiporter-2